MGGLIPYSMDSPGKWGVNLQEQLQPQRHYWATVADSMVINDSRQLAARGSISILSTVPAAAELLRIFDYVDSTGAEIVLTTTATKIIKTTGDLTAAGNLIQSTTAPTNGYWRFQNFNGKVVGWQASHTPIRWSGSGVFTDIVAASGTIPTGDAMVAAFGRIWAVDSDGQTIKFCALLDETKWATADGAGAIDMRNVWTQGMDRVTALAAFGSNLVVFGRKHIIFYSDGQGSALGIDPTQMFVVDTIEGTGCVSRDTVAAIGEGDLAFLSAIGVQSLGRVVTQKDNPLVSVSWQIADRISSTINTELVSATDLRTWTGVYDPASGQYKLVHRTLGDVYVLHFKAHTQDDEQRDVIPITIWDTTILSNIRQFVTMRTGVQYVIGGLYNNINTYTTTSTLDNSLSPIATEWQSGWVDFDIPEIETKIKVLKMVQASVLNPAGLHSVTTLKFGCDFSTTLASLASPDSSAALVRNIYDPVGDVEGKLMKFGLSEAGGGGRSLQNVMLHMKVGRIAFDHDVDGQAATTVVTLNPNMQLLVAVSDSNSSTSCVATSMNGLAWTARTATQAAWKGVAYSPTLRMLAAVANNNIMTSLDGITWTDRTCPGVGGWRSICWSTDLGMFVAVGTSLGSQRVMKSTDGITWTLVTTPANCDKTWIDVKYSTRIRAFFACTTGNPPFIMYSLDGTTWSLGSVPATTTGGGRLAESGSLIVMLNDSDTNHYVTSPDGVNWTQQTDGAFTSSSDAVVYSPTLDRFVFSCGAVFGLISSSNGGPAPLALTQRTTVGIHHIAAVWSVNLGKFFFINTPASNDAVEYSSDGITWSTVGALMPSTQNWFSVCETESV